MGSKEWLVDVLPVVEAVATTTLASFELDSTLGNL